jgi:hypothetical protein
MDRRRAMYKLFARPGWGSVLVEAQLAWYDLPHQIEELDDLFVSAAARDTLRPVNPLAQVPTLVLPGGQAERLCRRAIAIAPSYAQAHSLLAWVLLHRSTWSGDLRSVLGEISAEIDTALITL